MSKTPPVLGQAGPFVYDEKIVFTEFAFILSKTIDFSSRSLYNGNYIL